MIALQLLLGSAGLAAQHRHGLLAMSRGGLPSALREERRLRLVVVAARGLDASVVGLGGPLAVREKERRRDNILYRFT